MTSEVIIDVRQTEISIALLEDKRLVEYQNEPKSASFSVGNIYIAKVKKLMPGLNACFVDVGFERDAFLHYLDLGSQFNSYNKYLKQVQSDRKKLFPFSKATMLPDLKKDGSVQQALTVGQEVLVQIVKEPISTKGSRLTAEISLAGRNIVLLPFAEKVSVSQKISSKEEKKRLELLVRNILPKNYGAIIRTAAEGKSASVLDAELMSLVEKWEESWKKLARSKTVQLLFTEYSKTTVVLRDLLNDSFTNIHVNDEAVYEEIRKYISLISPEQEKIVHLYDGKAPIFDNFEVTRQIKSSFGKVVPIKQGAYLVIEHTEALHVVDVNSGTRSKNKEQEQNTFDVNCYAAEEIARQMRLRDMGGIVIVDFIDMETSEHRNALYKYMQELMEGDRAKHNVLPLTKFGLMQITRQRVRPATEIETLEVCPVCHGTGKISSSVVIDDDIERHLADIVADRKPASLTLKVSPILGSYLTRGLFKSILSRWKKKYKCKIALEEVTDFTVLQNEFYDEKGVRLE